MSRVHEYTTLRWEAIGGMGSRPELRKIRVEGGMNEYMFTGSRVARPRPAGGHNVVFVVEKSCWLCG